MSSAHSRPPQARLIVFEGPDEAGKTTIARALASRLMDEGKAVSYASFPGRDPGTLGQLVYLLHHDERSLGVMRSIAPSSRQLLHVAAHLDTIEQDVIPRLREGTSVILDRFWWSTWAYGSVAGVVEPLLGAMVTTELTMWIPIVPDALFLVQRGDPLAGRREALWRAYLDLAAREASKYPVHLLTNDGPVREAVSWVRERLPL